MKTFTTIERLLERINSLTDTQAMLLKQGCAGRTDAGLRFYLSQAKRLREMNSKLYTYPAQWIRAVEIVIALRT